MDWEEEREEKKTRVQYWEFGCEKLHSGGACFEMDLAAAVHWCMLVRNYLAVAIFSFATYKNTHTHSHTRNIQPRKLFNLCQFMCLDRDGDGSISTEECMEMIMHRYKLLLLQYLGHCMSDECRSPG